MSLTKFHMRLSIFLYIMHLAIPADGYQVDKPNGKKELRKPCNVMLVNGGRACLEFVQLD